MAVGVGTVGWARFLTKFPKAGETTNRSRSRSINSSLGSAAVRVVAASACDDVDVEGAP